MEQSIPATPAEENSFPATGETQEPVVKLTLRTPKFDCKHDKAIEQSKNKFYCLECGYMFRKIRQSVLQRRKMLR